MPQSRRVPTAEQTVRRVQSGVSTGNPLLDLFFLPEIIKFNLINRVVGNGR